MNNIIAYIVINGNINIVVNADQENVLLWGDERINCYEVQDISFEMEERNMGAVGSSFFTSDYSMFEVATQEQTDLVNTFLKSLNYEKL